MPEPEREPELVVVEPSEQSVILRAIVRSGLVEKLVTWLAAALVGGSAGMATRQVSDAGATAELAEARAELAGLKADYLKFKDAYWERQRTNRERADSEHKELEREQRAEAIKLERRLTRIEFKLNIQPPDDPAPAEQP